MPNVLFVQNGLEFSFFDTPLETLGGSATYLESIHDSPDALSEADIVVVGIHFDLFNRFQLGPALDAFVKEHVIPLGKPWGYMGTWFNREEERFPNLAYPGDFYTECFSSASSISEISQFLLRLT